MYTTEKKPVKPDNYLVWAILSTVLCCLPLGIVAIIKATQVDTLWAQGDYEGAVQAARDAKRWTWAGFFIALGISLVYLVIIVVCAVAAMKLS